MNTVNVYGTRDLFNIRRFSWNGAKVTDNSWEFFELFAIIGPKREGKKAFSINTNAAISSGDTKVKIFFSVTFFTSLITLHQYLCFEEQILTVLNFMKSDISTTSSHVSAANVKIKRVEESIKLSVPDLSAEIRKLGEMSITARSEFSDDLNRPMGNYNYNPVCSLLTL